MVERHLAKVDAEGSNPFSRSTGPARTGQIGYNRPMSSAAVPGELRSGTFKAIYDNALALVAPHCDIEERLTLVPATARLRGLYFKSVHEALERAGKIEKYRQYFPNDRHSAIPYYPLADYMLRVAVAGALYASPERIHEGMFDIARGNATAFTSSLLGRAMLRLLARDPVRVSEQGLAARRQSWAYGHWELIRHTPRYIEMVYRDEYQWIESLVAGAAQGTFEACGLSPKLETRLLDRFNGSTHIRW